MKGLYKKMAKIILCGKCYDSVRDMTNGAKNN